MTQVDNKLETSFLIQDNLLLADHSGPLFKTIFLASNIINSEQWKGQQLPESTNSVSMKILDIKWSKIIPDCFLYLFDL